MPRTSVLINNYNNGPYLRECLDSVLGQQPPPDEVIVYDDGSTDDSLAILRSYGDVIILLDRPHASGPNYVNQANAIAESFKVSTGELVFLLDGDDVFKPGKIAAYLAAYTSHENVCLVQSPQQRIGPQGEDLGLEYDPRRHLDDYLASLYQRHDIDFFYSTSALAFSRSYLEKRLPLDLSDGQQVWADSRLAAFAPHFGKIIALPEAYSYWRRHPQSASIKLIPMLVQSRRHAKFFNYHCTRYGLKKIHPWMGSRYWKQWVRYYLPFLLDFGAVLRRMKDSFLPGGPRPS